jgi:hypothetical protein
MLDITMLFLSIDAAHAWRLGGNAPLSNTFKLFPHQAYSSRLANDLKISMAMTRIVFK